jgi:Kef-type K+ transport system membrane component KefB
MDHNILLHLAIIIILSKIVGAISKKLKQPPVIGLLLLGVILGPTLIHLIEPGEVIKWIGKIGVLFLLFEAGLETNIARIKSESRQALIPAMGGIILPFILGFGISYLFNPELFQALIVGVIFTATSVSVSVMTLMDLGKMRGVEGRCIINAAIIDDIIGILLLTIVFGLTVKSDAGSSNILISFLKIVAFFVIALAAGHFLLRPFFINLKKLLMDNVVVALAVAFVLLYSWFAENAGLAAITGAYFAGLFIGQTEYRSSVQEGISLLGKSFFVDVFFVGIGLEFNLFAIEAKPLFLLIFVALALFGKIIGSGLGAKISRFDYLRSFRIGAGMMPRGEVALIVANMALQKGLIPTDLLSATIIMVIVSAIITPMMLKFGFTTLARRSFD